VCPRPSVREFPRATRESNEGSEHLVYAIVRSGGRQHKVAVGDVIEVNAVAGDTRETLELPAVLLVDGETVTADAKTLAGVTVSAEVIGTTKGPKIHILKFKNKTGYRRRLGHRQKFTQVRVTGISSN
jgi:large subunit ribosomal protein L21